MNNQLKAAILLSKGTASLMDYYNQDIHYFIRSSDSKVEDVRHYPTATFRSIEALCWVLKLANVESISIDMKRIINIIEDFFFRNIHIINEDDWASFLVTKSSHYTGASGVNNLLVYDRITSTLLELTKTPNIPDLNLKELVSKVIKYVPKKLDTIYRKNSALNQPVVDEFPIATIWYTNIILNLTQLSLHFDIDLGNKYKSQVDESLNHLHNVTNYQISRYSYQDYNHFDVIILSSCLNILSRNHLLSQDYLHYCFKIVSEVQFANGCWPHGTTLTSNSLGQAVHQPSVVVALSIIDYVFEKKYLSDYSEEFGHNIKNFADTLQLFGTYLENSFKPKKNGVLGGWSSDRIRKDGWAEIWITSLSVEFIVKFWLTKKALARQNALNVFNISENLVTYSLEERTNAWKQLIDPDSIHHPLEKIANEYINPIIYQQKLGYPIQFPKGVSFILFGPPGSGKTYVVNQISKALGWPVIELSPGHFITNGLEAIEDTAANIFKTLSDAFHTVVFMDECDELFRDRNNLGNNRTILSFATASMLPKLQKLHDSKNLIFILGTNFIQRMDSAIKRPGRFDNHFLFDRPDLIARQHFFSSQIEDTDIAFKLAEKSKGFTIPDLFKLIEHTDIKESQNGSLVDYKHWIEETGFNELSASMLPMDEQDLIKQRWKDI